MVTYGYMIVMLELSAFRRYFLPHIINIISQEEENCVLQILKIWSKLQYRK